MGKLVQAVSSLPRRHVPDAAEFSRGLGPVVEAGGFSVTLGARPHRCGSVGGRTAKWHATKRKQYFVTIVYVLNDLTCLVSAEKVVRCANGATRACVHDRERKREKESYHGKLIYNELC